MTHKQISSHKALLEWKCYLQHWHQNSKSVSKSCVQMSTRINIDTPSRLHSVTRGAPMFLEQFICMLIQQLMAPQLQSQSAIKQHYELKLLLDACTICTHTRDAFVTWIKAHSSLNSAPRDPHAYTLQMRLLHCNHSAQISPSSLLPIVIIPLAASSELNLAIQGVRHASQQLVGTYDQVLSRTHTFRLVHKFAPRTQDSWKVRDATVAQQQPRKLTDDSN